MARNQDSVSTRIFADFGQNVAVEPFEDGYTAEYEDDQFPTRQGLNFSLRQTTALGHDVNKGGCGLEYDDAIDYIQYAQIVYNGVTYVLLADNYIAGDPPTGENIGTTWQTLATFLGITALKTDTEYLDENLTGTFALVTTKGQESKYIVSDFQSNGVTIEDIRVIEIYTFGRGEDGEESIIDVSLDEGVTYKNIFEGRFGGGAIDESGGLVSLNIKKDTTQVWVRCSVSDGTSNQTTATITGFVHAVIPS